VQLDELRAALPDRSRIQREIGRGGMAVVYLAEDVPHGRDVAVKVLSPELTSSIDSERFKREIQIAARLSHPNILAAYDSGSANGLLYYVMPFVQGESLRARLDRVSQLPVEEAIAITCEVADALSYAHSQGVVHRDIKPANILIHSGHAVVADFGIAHVVQEAGTERLTQAGAGMSIGTAAYMSPEQFMGNTVDGRSDTYGLACLLYEMLVGQVPFTGPNAMAIMARHTMQAVPSIRLVRATVPEEVEAVIFRALEKTPADRFATIDAFKDALLGGVAVTPSYARSTPMYTAAYRAANAKRGPGRWRKIAGVAVGVLVLAGAAAVGRALLTPKGALAGADVAHDADARHLGVLYFADESRDGSLRFLADGLTESLIDELSRVPVLDVVSKNGVRPFRGLEFESVRDSIQRTLKVGTVVRGAVAPSAKGAQVTVRLVEAVSGVEIARKSFEADTANALAAQTRLSTEVAEFLRGHLGDEIRLKESRQGTSSSEAWTLLQRAEKRRKDADSLTTAGQSGASVQLLNDAEQQLARAEAIDPAWVRLPLARATIAYQRARALRGQQALAAAAIDSGMLHVTRALAIEPRSADALELRGKLEYLRIEQQLVLEGPEWKRTLERADADLRAAVDLNPLQAGAWVTLSSLAYKKQNVQDALNAAQKAYAADAYLTNARDVLRRLFWTSHDIEMFPDAAKWCAEGHRRFPRDAAFVECRLWMLTTKAMTPDPGEAWQLVDSLRALTPPSDSARAGRHARIVASVVLARAGLADSARRVLLRSRGTPEIDPKRELQGDEAIARVFLHDYDEAIALLESYLAANPEHRKGFATNTSLWWKDPKLQAHPRFRALIAGAR
jgi:TolB-like protein